MFCLEAARNVSFRHRDGVLSNIRELIEEIRLVPENGKLRIELYGELAALINLANEHPRSKETGVQISPG
jgi:hypothetical protein